MKGAIDPAMATTLYAGLYVPRGDLTDPARRRATGSDPRETVRHRSLPARRYRSPSSTSPVRPPSINCT
ncbi:MAG: hypothetical protein ACKOFX_06365, partial [Solirubrobacterales bacterium]